MPKFLNTPSINQWNTPLGYNREEWQHRLNDGLDSKINLYNPESFSRVSPHTNLDQFNYWGNQVGRSAFIWDSIPELAKYPITGKPQEYSTQYVMVPVTPPTNAQKKASRNKGIAQAIRTVFLAKPYGG